MATFGRMSEFDGLEDWGQYEERLGHYFTENDITDAGKQRAILLTVCGSKTYNLLRSLLAPTKPGEKTYDELTKLRKEHYDPKPSMIVQRYKFNS